MLDPGIRLRQSIIDGNLLVVKRLLKRFPDLLENIDPTNGWSSLHYASYNGRYLVCVHLISLAHDKKEILKTFKKNTSIHLALMNGHEQTAHLLLQHFPNQINVKGEFGYAPIHVSTIKDYFKCVEMLLVLGADINVLDDDGNNALHLAMKYGSLETIKLLVQKGIRKDQKNKHSLKPVDVASTFQIEKFYENVVKNIKTAPTFIDVEESTKPQRVYSTSNETTQAKSRSHSTSLPPLPTVTTARRPSNASSLNKSPIPRSAISLGFTGSNTNSYVYSPTQNAVPSYLNTFIPLGGSVKSSPLGAQTPPTSFSPSNSNVVPVFNKEDFPQNNTKSQFAHSTSLSSFPSMSSMSSGRNTPTEGRTRASSQNQIIDTSFSKTRSNSGGSRSTGFTPTFTPHDPVKQPGKISPPSSNLNLSRTSTFSASNTSLNSDSTNAINESMNYEISKESLTSNNTSGTGNNSRLLSNFEINNELRQKISEKFDSAANEYKKRTKPGASILNIPIASLSRKKSD